MINKNFLLEKKTILITGASSGIGACTAIECSKVGAKVIITGRNKDRLKETFDQLVGDENIMIPFDLCDQNKILDFCSLLPALDGINFCAGISRISPLKFIKKTDIDDIFSTNITSNMIIIQTLLKQKKILSNASIVFISSVYSHYANMGDSVYAASKGAVNSFIKVAALELSTRKIRVNAIEPGFIPTQIIKDRSQFSNEQLEDDLKNYPLGIGEPIDIANGVIFLLSDASKWITGSNMIIDGGLSVR